MVCVMQIIQPLFDLVDAYREAMDVTESHVSGKVFKDWDRIAQIRAGKSDIKVGRFLRAIDWFDENWPADVSWPATVKRPSLVNERAA